MIDTTAVDLDDVCARIREPHDYWPDAMFALCRALYYQKFHLPNSLYLYSREVRMFVAGTLRQTLCRTEWL